MDVRGFVALSYQLSALVPGLGFRIVAAAEIGMGLYIFVMVKVPEPVQPLLWFKISTDNSRHIS